MKLRRLNEENNKKLSIVFRNDCALDEYEFASTDSSRISKYADDFVESLNNKDEATYLKLVNMYERYYGINFKATKVLSWGDNATNGWPELEYKSIKSYDSIEALEDDLYDLDLDFVLEDTYTKINGKSIEELNESLNEGVSKDRHGIIKLAKEIADEIDSYTNLGRVFSIADTVILSDLGAIIRVLDNNNFVYADDNFTHNYSDVYDMLYDIFGEEEQYRNED